MPALHSIESHLYRIPLDIALFQSGCRVIVRNLLLMRLSWRQLPR